MIRELIARILVALAIVAILAFAWLLTQYP